MADFPQLNPYEAPRGPIEWTSSGAPGAVRRSRWATLRWLPFAYCLIVAFFGIGFVVVRGIPGLVRLSTLPGTDAGRGRLVFLVGICVGFLLLSGLGAYAAFAWKNARWRRAVVATLILVGSARLLTWSIGG